MTERETGTVSDMKNAVFWDVAPCRYVLTDVSEERIAFIFRVEAKKENPQAKNQREQVLIDSKTSVNTISTQHTSRRLLSS
jgi:hypothetical protein